MSSDQQVRATIDAAMAQQGVDATGLARLVGKDRDYIRDFLAGRKKSISADALLCIERLANGQINEGFGDGRSSRRGSDYIHIGLEDLHTVVVATLRTLSVPEALAVSRANDLVAQLREISEARDVAPEGVTVRIDRESGDPKSVDPSGQ